VKDFVAGVDQGDERRPLRSRLIAAAIKKTKRPGILPAVFLLGPISLLIHARQKTAIAFFALDGRKALPAARRHRAIG